MIEIPDGHRLAEQMSLARKRARQSESDQFPPVAFADFSTARRQEVFLTAKAAWDAVFDAATLAKLVEQSSSDVSDYNRHIKRAIKDVRRQGTILYSTYFFFDADHKGPNGFRTMLRYLGKLNDNLSPKAHTKYKQLVLAELAKHDYSVLPAISPVSDEDYQQFVSQELAKLRQDAAQTRLSVTSYHNMRKSLRNFMNILQITSVLTSDQAVTQSFMSSHHLDSEMGHLHDDLLTEAQKGKLDYETASILIPESFRTRLQRFTDAIS